MTRREIRAAIEDQRAKGIVHEKAKPREPGKHNGFISGQPKWQSVHELSGIVKFKLAKTREEAFKQIANERRQNAGIYYVRQWEHGEWHFDCYVLPEKTGYNASRRS